VSPVLLAPWIPEPGQLERAFAPFASLWGVRHGGMDTAMLFFLVLLRWVAIVQLCPFLGGRLVPGPVKMGLAILMAWFSTPWLSHQLAVPLTLTAAQYWMSMFHELAIGLLIGFGSSLVFLAAQMGGEFLDSARGTTAANVLVPQLQVQSSLLGDFYFQLFIVLYLLGGGHRWFFQAALDSYRVFPPTGSMPGSDVINESFVRMGVMIFGIMIKTVAPAILVVILVDVVLGVANRMAPQMDVFFLGLALKPALGALIVAVSLYGLLSAAPEIFRSFHAWMGSWLTPAARP
jgi:flagellar biosynthesis protein FliR